MPIWKSGPSSPLPRHGGAATGTGQFETLGKQGSLRDTCTELDLNLSCRTQKVPEPTSHLFSESISTASQKEQS